MKVSNNPSTTPSLQSDNQSILQKKSLSFNYTVCPWCYGLTKTNNEQSYICDCCSNLINEEDFYYDQND
jgi:hypothetical protein